MLIKSGIKYLNIPYTQETGVCVREKLLKSLGALLAAAKVNKRRIFICSRASKYR